MSSFTVSRREFVQGFAAGVCVVTTSSLLAPSASAAYQRTIPAHATGTVMPELQREYAHPCGSAFVRSWRSGNAQVLIDRGRLLLEAPLLGSEQLTASDIQSGLAQERIERVFGVGVAEEVMRELSACGF